MDRRTFLKRSGGTIAVAALTPLTFDEVGEDTTYEEMFPSTVDLPTSNPGPGLMWNDRGTVRIGW